MNRTITPHKGGRSERIYARVTPEVKQRLSSLAKAEGITVADWLEEQVMMNSENRNDQVDWLRQQIDIILASDMSDGGETANEMVRFWENSFSYEGEELPDWYNDHDRRLLIGWINESL